MTQGARPDWDARYRAQPGARPGPPSHVLTANTHLLPRVGTALDLACGTGGNALFLARHGLTVFAWDISPTAIGIVSAAARREGMAVQAAVQDLGTVNWQAHRFDVIVVSRYLDRTLAPALVGCLADRGLLFFQTFTRAKLSAEGPSNPAFLLADNELLTLFAPLSVRYYREDGRCGNLQAGLRSEACFVGEKPVPESFGGGTR